jgi:uncharacterized protein (TIGR00255 family)
VSDNRRVPVCPVRSMTGFAQVRRTTSAGELTVSLRSVNHRGLDLHFHQTPDLGMYENAIRELLRRNIARGYVEVRLSLSRRENETACLKRDLLARYLTLFQQLSLEFGLDSKPNLNAMFSLPGVFDAAPPDLVPDEFQRELLDAVAACAAGLNECREREGQQLCGGIEREISGIESDTKEIIAIRRLALGHFHERLRERLKDLLDTAVPESRLAEEAAMLADRSDIQEELTRLEVHTGELRRILSGGGETGKRLDFLLQEMNRESNTILSKTTGIGEAGLTITRLGLSLKAKIEKIREQALNLE